jgi:hypothetical protein
MFAMAELLYVADHYFDELRRTREERKREGENDETAK